ncbi:tricarboxylate transport protein-like [Homarus americanus]|uniref:Citrate transport protein n=1 Tax=Homarus americanus TaxID=6706 RepID=A0A8J5NA77_HOMAM|nr:tricarboxylate transport protein-like [Homarus americanus]
MDNPSPAYRSPFLRPWMSQSGAAAPSGGGNIGLKGIIAGGITGGIEICITFPTEYVKTQLQLDEKGAGKRQYNGIVDCVKKTVSSHGVLGLYRGLSVLLYGSIPKSACRFGAFEQFKKHSVDERGNLSPGKRLLCGLGAGVTEAIFAVTPMETVKGSNQAMRFYVMETCKDKYRGGDPTKPVPKLLVGVFGGLAGAVSVFGNTPIDVVKTRMQGLEASKYKNTFDCFCRIWKNEGPRAFYKGTVPRLSRVCLDVAITFMIYDTFMELFSKVWK